MDFFAGSATTAHAVMSMNAEDGGNRRFINVQIPEPCEIKVEHSRRWVTKQSRKLEKNVFAGQGKKLWKGNVMKAGTRILVSEYSRSIHPIWQTFITTLTLLIKPNSIFSPTTSDLTATRGFAFPGPIGLGC